MTAAWYFKIALCFYGCFSIPSCTGCMKMHCQVSFPRERESSFIWQRFPIETLGNDNLLHTLQREQFYKLDKLFNNLPVVVNLRIYCA